MKKKIHLAWFGSAGPSTWRAPSNNLYDWRRPEIYQDVARLCERAKFDLVLFSDNLAVQSAFGGSNDFYVQHGIMINHDPVPTLTMMGAATSRIGLGSTLSSTFYPPFLLARLLATLDHLTRGRIAWNVVTTASRNAAQNFGYDNLPEHDERYDMADEYLELCRALWDSWGADAVVMDRETGIFGDPTKVHPVHYAGKYHRSRGPLTVTSSPQRYPVIIMAGTSPRGQRFAVGNADMVIAHKNTVEDMRKYSSDLRTQLSAVGRDRSSCKVFFSIEPVIGDTETIAKEKLRMRRDKANIHEGLARLSSTLGHDMTKFDLDAPLPAHLPVNAIIGKMLQYRVANEELTLRQIAQHEAMHETFPICGTPEQVADIIEQTARDGDADGFHFRAGFHNYEYVVDVTTKLVPILQDRGLARKEYSGTTLRDHLFEF